MRTQIDIPEVAQDSYAWKFFVLERDNHACQQGKDGEHKGRIETHHIDRNPELSLVVSNGITLCLKHHKKQEAELRKTTSKSIPQLQFPHQNFITKKPKLTLPQAYLHKVGADSRAVYIPRQWIKEQETKLGHPIKDILMSVKKNIEIWAE